MFQSKKPESSRGVRHAAKVPFTYRRVTRYAVFTRVEYATTRLIGDVANSKRPLLIILSTVYLTQFGQKLD